MISPPLSEAEARRIVATMLEAASAEHVRVAIAAARGGNTRFANNGVTTAGDVRDLEVEVTAAFGTRTGAATTNGIDPEALARVVGRAEEAARLAPEDLEAMPPLGAGEYPSPDGWRDATARFGPRERAAAAAAAIDEAETRGGVVAGFVETVARALAIADSAGLFVYHPETVLEYTNTVRTPDGRGAGWAGVRLPDATDLDARSRARVAADKAVASSRVRPLEPGDHPVILEPVAVAALAGALVRSMDARRAMEGRSYLSAPDGGTRLGERLLSEGVTIATDPADPTVPARPWAGEGLPARPTVWYRDGRVNRLQYDRWWAGEQGVEPVPEPTNLIVSGGDGSLEDLVAATDRAVLVTRLWYVRSLNPRDLTLTGLTRDGTFWVENGRVRHAINNFRWNESPVRFFSRVEAMSRPVPVADTAWAISPSKVPAVRAGSFHFSSVSQAV